MAVRIEISEGMVAQRVLNAFKAGLPDLSNAIRDDCNIYCKEDTGRLIVSSLFASSPENGQLVWDTPYAKRQYWEIQTAHKTVNPNASWKWCEVAKSRHLIQWEIKAQALLEKNL